MGLFNGKEATVWMRATRPHTYESKPYDVDDVYLAHEEMVETIEILKFAVREPSPPKAVRAEMPAAEVPSTAADQSDPTSAVPMTTDTAAALTRPRRR